MDHCLILRSYIKNKLELDYINSFLDEDNAPLGKNDPIEMFFYLYYPENNYL